MKVKDLIEIIELETVIKLPQNFIESEKNYIKKILDTFVITDDVLNNLIRIFNSIKYNQGGGFFLKGSYGSGKSHFLSIIGAIAQYPDLAETLSAKNNNLNEFIDCLKEKKFLCIKIPLVLFKAEENLEQIFYSAAEKELFYQSHTIILSDEKTTVENFLKYISDEIKNEFFDYLKSSNINFNSISINYQANLIKEYIGKNNIPIKLFYSREQAFEKLFNLINKKIFDGMIILLDELSEFLRAKPNQSLLDEDTRFLQYLGELSQDKPLWIIAALQEDIREIVKISDNIFNKIKDRYKFRLNLTTHHIEELIDKRLVVKKPGAVQVIENYYNELKNIFAFAKIDKERFLKLYPVANPTVIILDSIASIFSKQRGIVDFIHYRIKGDDKRGIKGILEDDFKSLLTPDKIFDHFENNIQEYDESHPYYEIVYKYYLRELPNFFKEESERELAFRIIKLLILVKISPTINDQSVKSIVNMIMYKFSEIDSILNYEYVYENIIKTFIYQMSFISETKKENFYDNIISIDIDLNINKIIKNRCDLILKSIGAADDKVVKDFLNEFKLSFLPISDLYNREIIFDINFKNSLRKGYITLVDLFNLNRDIIAKYNAALARNDLDFFIIIGIPFLNIRGDSFNKIRELMNDLSKEIKSSFYFWIPSDISQNEYEEFKNYYAYKMTLARVEAEGNKKSEQITEFIKTKLNIIRKTITDILIKSYIKSEFFFNDEIETIEESFLLYGQFTDIIKQTVHSLLSKKYPLFDKIRPSISNYNIEQLNRLIKYFFREGSISFQNAQNYNILTILEGLLIPLKLCEKKSNIYYLKIQPAKSEILIDYLEKVQRTPVSVKELYNYFRKSEYGMTKEIFLLIIYSLFFVGFIQGKKNNRRISQDVLMNFDIDAIDEISAGEIIDAEIQQKLYEIDFIIDKSISKDIFTIDTQNKIWENIIGLKRDFLPCLIELEMKLSELINYSIFTNSKFIGDLKISIKNAINILNNIKVSYNSNDGIESFISNIDDVQAFQKDLNILDNFARFLKNYFQDYIFMHKYLNQIYLPDTESELNNEKNILISKIEDIPEFMIDMKFDEIKKEFFEFQSKYIELYTAQHKLFNSDENLQIIRDIKDSIEYDILSRFKGIQLLAVENDITKIEYLLKNFFDKNCRKLNIEQLYALPPVCNCGYKIGTEPLKIRPAEIYELMQKGIKEYLLNLKNPAHYEKIFVYITGLKKINKNDIANKIEDIINLNANEPIDKINTKLKYLLSNEIIREINKSLIGETVIIERDVKNLLNIIEGKCLSYNQLLTEFQNWINPTNSEKFNNIYIHCFSSDRINKSPLLQEINGFFLNGTDSDKITKFLICCWLIIHNYDIDQNFYLLTGQKINLENKNKFLDLFEQYRSSLKVRTIEKDIIINNLLGIMKIEIMNIDELLFHFKKEILFEEIKLELCKNIIKKIIDEKILLDNSALCESSEMNEMDDMILLTNYLIKIYNLKITNENISIDWWIKEIFDKYISTYHYNLCKYIFYYRKYEFISKTIFDEFIFCVDKKVVEQEKIFSRLSDEKNCVFQISCFKERFIKNKSKYAIFIIDGLRYDLAKYLMNIAALKNKNIILDYQFAPPPTDTEHQRSALFKGKYLQDSEIDNAVLNRPEIFGTDCVWINCSELDYKFEKIIEEINNKEKIILGIGYIDEKMHNEKFDIASFYREIKILFEKQVIPLLNALPADYDIYLIADHGFNFEMNFKNTGRYKYSHGGNSVFEIITPVLHYFNG